MKRYVTAFLAVMVGNLGIRLVINKITNGEFNLSGSQIAQGVFVSAVVSVIVVKYVIKKQ